VSDRATTKAKNALRKANKEETVGDLELVGDLRLLAGLTTDCSGFGAFDGKYIISKATHKVTAGYSVSIEARKCLNGY